MASKHQMLNDTPAIELGNVSSRREHEDLELQSEKPRSRWAGFLERNRGVFLILIAEIFGAGMAATTRLLQLGSGTVSGMDTLQVGLWMSCCAMFFLLIEVLDSVCKIQHHFLAQYGLYVVCPDTELSSGSPRGTMDACIERIVWIRRCVWLLLYAYIPFLLLFFHPACSLSTPIPMLPTLPNATQP